LSLKVSIPHFICCVAAAQGFVQKNRFNSFAPERVSVDAGWFVDGSSYMSAVADALEGAKEEIFIANWWLSPEIYMKRPFVDGDYWRLDKILHRKAVSFCCVLLCHSLGN
jgi:phospholipase D1/2